MIPVTLKMQGFLTFRQPTEIRFDEFSSDGIFLISGPTGAGKTSIFDAISFALYGVATTSQRQPAELRSHLITADEDLSVELLFRAGSHEYRVARSQKGLRPMKQSLTVDGDEKNQLTKVRDIQEKIFEVLGLSADQFCKIVMLPQGEFRNFLSASSKDKSDILRKLFDTDHYARIREMIRTRLSEIKARVDQAELIITAEKKISEAAQGSLDPEEIKAILSEELHQAVAVCAESHQSGQLLRAQLDALALKLEEAGRINGECESKEKLEEALAKAAPGEKDARSQLEKAELLSRIRPLTVHHNTLRQNRRSFESKTLKLKQLGEALKTSRAGFAAADEEAAKNPKRQEELTALVREIDKIGELFDALKEKHAVAKDHGVAKRTAGDLAKELDEYRILRAEETALTREKEALTEQLMAVQEETARLREQYQDKKRQKDEASAWCELQKSLDEGRAREKALQEQLSSLLKRTDEAKGRYEQLKDEASRQGLTSFSHLLADGQPCPLCGSLDHPAPFQEDPKLNQTALKQADQTWRSLEREKIEAGRDLAHLQQELSKNAREAQRLQLSFDPAVLLLDPALLERDLKQLAEDGKAKNFAADGLKTRLNELDLRRNLLVLKLSSVAEIEQRFQSARDEMNALQLKLSALEDKSRDLDETGLKKELEAKNRQKKALSDSISQAEASYRMSQKEVTRLEADVTSLGLEVSDLTCLIREQEGFVADELEKLELSHEEFLDLENQADQEVSLRKHAAEFLKNLEDDRLRLALVKERLDGRVKVDLETLNGEILQKKTEEAAKASAYDAALKRETALEQALKKVSEAVAVYKKNALGLKVARQLDLTTGKGTTFENYVLGYYLEGVLINANARLKNMTSGRFCLVRQAKDSGGKRSIEGLDLNVYDSYSNSERDVKTLSGGEGFKASLALALGLSDFILEKKSGIRLDTMFIDEGFGTLDQESLDSAMETIMELQGLGRLVGIISHVEELKERIPTQILVENRRGDGSVVRIVKH